MCPRGSTVQNMKCALCPSAIMTERRDTKKSYNAYCKCIFAKVLRVCSVLVCRRAVFHFRFPTFRQKYNIFFIKICLSIGHEWIYAQNVVQELPAPTSIKSAHFTLKGTRAVHFISQPVSKYIFLLLWFMLQFTSQNQPILFPLLKWFFNCFFKSIQFS